MSSVHWHTQQRLFTYSCHRINNFNCHNVPSLDGVSVYAVELIYTRYSHGVHTLMLIIF